jgi:hypothetical protein
VKRVANGDISRPITGVELVRAISPIDSNCRPTLAAFQIVLGVLPADDQFVELHDAERASPVAQAWAHLLTMPCYTSEYEKLED